MENRLTLYQRDKLLNRIEDEINYKKHYIIKKRNDLTKKIKLNNFLLDVKNDYNKYYNYILTEKQQQYKALEMLKDYLDDLVKTEGFLEHQLFNAKNEQKNILKEMTKIKNELDILTK